MHLFKIILGVAVIATTAFGTVKDEKKRKTVCLQMTLINEVLGMYKHDNKSYPTTEEGLDAIIKTGDKNKYFGYLKSGYFFDEKVLVDTWQNAFNYRSNSERVELFSPGPDGIADTGDDILFSRCNSI